MRYCAGLLLFLGGAWLAYAGLAHRRRVVAAQGEAKAAAPAHPSLATLGDFFAPLVVAGFAYIGVKMTFVFLVLDAGRVFSAVDLAGFLTLLAGYGAWLVLRTRYRDPAVAAAQVDRRAGLARTTGDQREEPGRDVVGAHRLPGADAGAGARPGAGDLGAAVAAEREAA
jgi:hypothetical protein